ncbi:hypothetical protein F4678DRAFT_446514 [Xylaria arbuscula]|nr:hypothetical protein F4678DRAFT_446514 [Xylaria arbuscula]
MSPIALLWFCLWHLAPRDRIQHRSAMAVQQTVTNRYHALFELEEFPHAETMVGYEKASPVPAVASGLGALPE